MTIFIDKTKETEEKKVVKKTVFVRYIDTDGKINDAGFKPECYDYVELINRKDEYNKFDLFIAYDNESNFKRRFLGYAGDEFK